MSDTARDVAESIERLSRDDPTLKWIFLNSKQHTDAELADCLLAHPDVAAHVHLGSNQLTDETGVKLARYVAVSSTIVSLDMSMVYNQLGSETYLALAAALRVNSSLHYLYLNGNQAVDRTNIDAAFIETLRLNPDCPTGSVWILYSLGQDDFKRLKEVADKLGAPSMLSELDFAEEK